MSDLAVTSPVNPAFSACPAAAQTSKPEDKKPAPKVDVIDMSKPPTPEQAERMRNNHILGYGKVSAEKTVSTTTMADGSTTTHFVMSYEHEYFDAVNEVTYRHSSIGAGVLAEDGTTVAGIAFRLSFTSLERWPEQLEQTADTLAAAHQAKLSYLNGTFSGEELEKRVSDLADAYQSAKDTAAGSVSNLLCRFLEPKDRAGIEPDIRSGVQGLFARYEEKYSAIAAQQKDGSWLGATLYESTVNLRMGTYGQYTPPKQNEDGSWDLAEYRYVSVAISGYQAILSAAHSGDGTETQLLAKFSEVSMKAEAVTVGGRNPGAAELFRISGKNAYLELLTALGREPERGFQALA